MYAKRDPDKDLFSLAPLPALFLVHIDIVIQI